MAWVQRRQFPASPSRLSRTARPDPVDNAPAPAGIPHPGHMPDPTPAEAAASAARGRVRPPGPLGDARGRSGPFTRADALAAGHTPGAIRVRLRRGDWRRVRTGVYSDGRSGTRPPAIPHPPTP